MTSPKAPAHGSAQTGPLPFDTSVAHQARMYDYLLDGKDNYAADRAATEAWIEIDPDIAFTVRANRAFLGRVVRYLAADAGVRQFLDIGTGIPTAGNTHQVAQAIGPESKVVYVDYDPVVLAHARALLTSGEAGATEYIEADLRDTGTILTQAAELLDFTKPVAITLLAILHVVPDADDPHAIVSRLLDAMPAGSYLALSHLGTDLLDRDKQDGVRDVADRLIRQMPTYRSREQVARFFDGTDLVAPGLVRVEEWRPEPEAGKTARSSLWCGAGRKRSSGAH
jgi:S-adenosyl methyltransferase